MEGLEGLISLRELVLDRNKIKVISSQPSKQFGACIFYKGNSEGNYFCPYNYVVSVACEMLDFNCPCFLVYFSFRVT